MVIDMHLRTHIHKQTHTHTNTHLFTCYLFFYECNDIMQTVSSLFYLIIKLVLINNNYNLLRYYKLIHGKTNCNLFLIITLLLGNNTL